MTSLDPRIRKRIDNKLAELNTMRPLAPAQVKKLREQLQIEMTYNSNAIEGNSLTLRETYLVLREGMTIKGKPLKDHLEAKDHQEALDFLFELVSGKRVTVTEMLIRQVHHLVVRETESEHAGKYRTGSVMIAGAKHAPPEAVDVPPQMQSLVRWIRSHQEKLHRVELAARTHHRMVHIHPFLDGNGRTARLVMNVLLMQAGYPIAIILKNDRKKYYQVLEKADGEDYRPLALLITQAVERTLDLYLRTFKPAGVGKLLSLAEASRGTPYGSKYLNLLARTGRIAASKRGRIWYTTIEAISTYRTQRIRRRK